MTFFGMLLHFPNFNLAVLEIIMPNLKLIGKFKHAYTIRAITDSNYKKASFLIKLQRMKDPIILFFYPFMLL